MVIGRDKKRNVFSNLHKNLYHIDVFTAGCDNFSEIRPDFATCSTNISTKKIKNLRKIWDFLLTNSI